MPGFIEMEAGTPLRGRFEEIVKNGILLRLVSSRSGVCRYSKITRIKRGTMIIRRSRSADEATIIRFITQDSGLSPIQDFSAEPDQVTVRYEKNRTMILCGIGPGDGCTASILRSASAKAIRQAQILSRSKVACEVPGLRLPAEDVEAAIIDGAVLGSYKFTKYKSDKPGKVASVVLAGGTLSSQAIRKRLLACEATNYARDLVNDNASVVTPSYIAKEARKLAATKNCRVTVLGADALKRERLDLISAVGGASPTPPVLILLEYRGAPGKKTGCALVGKGVTFDSGGQNLKPTGSIESMRHDMAGAAAVLGAFSACISSSPPINIVGAIPAVHNAIGGKAFFPGDVYSSYSGKSVEIWSTDAEGRLILADAISYCCDKYHPECIIDCATLTGGIVTALGEFVAGLFSNDDSLSKNLFDAGEKTGERLWRLPIYKEYADSLKGDIGDIRNLSKFKKGFASSITGAAFIREFVKNTPWAHLDIAGTAFNEGAARGEVPQFATGFGVRLLLSFLGVM